MITAIILAGGTGSRTRADRPKQFVEVLNKPILAYTIEIFQITLKWIQLRLYVIRIGKIIWKK